MTKPLYSARAIANTILEQAQQDQINDVSPMKLQKLLYFAHGWYLANTDKPLISEPIEAWSYGPVIESVYHDFKHYGRSPISKLTKVPKVQPDGTMTLETPKTDDKAICEFIKELLDAYGGFTAIELANLTHEKDSSWTKIRERFGDIIEIKSIPIPDEIIKQEFIAKLQES